MKLSRILLLLVSVATINSVGHAQDSTAQNGTGVLVGRVVYPDGKPARGIHIAAEIQRAYVWELVQNGAIGRKPGGVYTAKAADFLQTQTNMTALTGSDGTFRLEGLVTAPYNIKITGAPSAVVWYLRGMPAQWTASAAQGIWAKTGETRRRAQNIVLTRGALIKGRVTDQSGQPLAGIYVASGGPHRPTSGDSSAASVSDTNGRYEMRVPPGTIKMYVAGPFQSLPPIKATLDGKAQTLNGFSQFSLPVSIGQTHHLDYTITQPSSAP